MKHLLRATALLLGIAASPAGAQVINVEVDYMVASDHSHMPSAAEISALVEMFACHGYTLNIIVDDALPHVDVMQCDLPGFSDFWTCTSQNFTTYAEIKAANFDNAFGGWHYCVFGHQYDNGNGTDSSGLGEVGGNDFIVTLGAFSGQTGTAFERAATLAHELGHNLGLRHWSPLSLGPVGNFAPNYASVMSYQYQLTGVRSQMRCLGLVDQDDRLKDLDYSSGRMPSLTESGLTEAIGVGIHAVDWDCDGVLDGSAVVQDLDNERPWCTGVGPAISLLRDNDDWTSLLDSADNAAVIDGTAQLDTVSCITASELRDVKAFLGAIRASGSSPGLSDPTLCEGSSPTLAAPGCFGGEMFWVDAAATGVPLGTGDFPIASFSTAVNAAPSGSVLYLQPGTFTERSGSVLVTKPLVLAGPGGAVIAP